jgi:DUF1365 family protein
VSHPPTPALYKGRVRHTRLEPFGHSFEYRVFYGLFDIDGLDDLDERLRLLSVGRWNLFGFDVRDHGPIDGSPLRPWLDTLLAEADVDLEGGRVLLLAHPRVLGYAFNPISIWYCYGPSGDLRAVVHEVRNTFGHRHNYVVPVSDGALRHQFDKMLHVSPFNEMDQSYSFSLTEPGERLAVSIDLADGRGRMFRAGMGLTRIELSDGNLMRMFLTHPLLTLKVIGGIHWQAFRIWLKGGRYHPAPQPAEHPVTVVMREAVTT